MSFHLQLDGNDYISVPSSTSFDITNSFKISITFAPQDLNETNKYLMNRTQSTTGSSWAVIWEYTNNKVEFYSFGFTGSDPRTGSGITLSDSGQHTIVYDYDGTTFRGYLDGVQQFALTKTFSLPTTNSTLYIGASSPTTDMFAGSLYQVDFYKSGALTGQWLFNSGSGTTVSDNSGNGNTATITGATWVSDGSGGTEATITAIAATATSSAIAPTVTAQQNVSITSVIASSVASGVAPTVSAQKQVAITSVAANSNAATLAPTVGSSALVSAMVASAAAAGIVPTVNAVRNIEIIGNIASALAVAGVPRIPKIGWSQIANNPTTWRESTVTPTIWR